MTDEMMIAVEWWLRGWRFGRFGREDELPRTCEEAAEWLAGYRAGKSPTNPARRSRALDVIAAKASPELHFS